MAKTPKFEQTYETVVLGVLAYEFSPSDRTDSERTIKRRLRYRKLGTFEPGRVEALRVFTEDVREEIGRWTKSPYYTGRHGKFASMEDFDIARLSNDMAKRHRLVPRAAIDLFVPFAVFLYYLR